MFHATATIDREREIGPIDPMIFGQYLEHVQPEDACIYGAVLDEGSPLADATGLRRDVIAACRELAVPVVRWPGGCFADIYHWEDGIGPRDQRPARRNWHWGGLESNRFGTDEFLAWCERIDTAPYLNLNLGTGTLDEAVRWLDYCNGSEPTADVQRRRANGRQAPWDVRLWGVGNEQWGAWEAGHMDAATYAARIRNWIPFLRKLDPAARFLGIGSRAANDPEWDLHVLHECGHLLDYLTLHVYGYNVVADAEDYDAVVTFPCYVEERIRRLEHLIAAAADAYDLPRLPRIAIDEWNVRHLVAPAPGERPVLRRRSPRMLRDAIAAAGVFHAMIRHAPSVGMANYVFLVNGNGVLLVEPDGIVKTPLFHAFRLYRQLLGDIALDVRSDVPRFLTAVRTDEPGQSETSEVPAIDVVATWESAASRLALAIVNRHQTDPAEIAIRLDGISAAPVAEIDQLTHADPMAINDGAAPDRVHPRTWRQDWTGTVQVPPHSITLVRLDGAK